MEYSIILPDGFEIRYGKALLDKIIEIKGYSSKEDIKREDIVSIFSDSMKNSLNKSNYVLSEKELEDKIK